METCITHVRSWGMNVWTSNHYSSNQQVNIFSRAGFHVIRGPDLVVTLQNARMLAMHGVTRSFPIFEHETMIRVSESPRFPPLPAHADTEDPLQKNVCMHTCSLAMASSGLRVHPASQRVRVGSVYSSATLMETVRSSYLSPLMLQLTHLTWLG